ncbi:hypothetical protein OI71_11270 [Aeromonas hydrophila]|nr:hypothetical protein OI71_11270 [Aeromonas hydrophila]
MQQDVAQPRHRVGGGGADPLLQQHQHPGQLEAGARQQIDDELAVQTGGQRLIDPLLEQQRRIAVLAEQVEQDEVVLRLALLQKGEGIGLEQGRRSLRVVVGLKEQLIEGDHLFVEVDTLVASIGPALVQMAGEIAAPQPQLEDAAGLLGQQTGDHLLVRQAEGGGFGQGHGRLHHAIDLQPAVMGIFLYGEPALGLGAEVQ